MEQALQYDSALDPRALVQHLPVKAASALHPTVKALPSCYLRAIGYAGNQPPLRLTIPKETPP